MIKGREETRSEKFHDQLGKLQQQLGIEETGETRTSRQEKINSFRDNNNSNDSSGTVVTTVEDVSKAYHKLWYCTRKPAPGLRGKKLKFPLDYGFGTVDMDQAQATLREAALKQAAEAKQATQEEAE
jgi:hypothetical protein